MGRGGDRPDGSHRVRHAAGDLVFASAAALAPVGFVVARRRPVAYLLGGWVALHLVMTAISGWAGPRFREPIEAPLFILAACVVAGGWRSVRRSQIAVGVIVAVFAGMSAAMSLPRSLAGRADYGMGSWRRAAVATRRQATTVAGLPAGFNVSLARPVASPGRNRLAGVLTPADEWPNPIEVEVWVNGRSAGAVTVNGESPFELTLGDRTTAFVELRPAESARIAPRLAVGLFDHHPRTGR